LETDIEKAGEGRVDKYTMVNEEHSPISILLVHTPSRI
jgi:hypothetical protein